MRISEGGTDETAKDAKESAKDAEEAGGLLQTCYSGGVRGRLYLWRVAEIVPGFMGCHYL